VLKAGALCYLLHILFVKEDKDPSRFKVVEECQAYTAEEQIGWETFLFEKYNSLPQSLWGKLTRLLLSLSEIPFVHHFILLSPS
jgi:hypothetical protein